MPWHRHERGWENLRQLCKSETKSRVCLTVENSPNASSVYIRLCKHRKKFFYCFCKITFPRKESKTLCMAMIKREILTSRKILSTKSCTRNQFLFCKKMLCKIRILLAWNVSLSKEKLTQIGGGWGVGVLGLGETFTKCKIYGGQEKMKHSDLSSPVWFS